MSPREGPCTGLVGVRRTRRVQRSGGLKSPTAPLTQLQPGPPGEAPARTNSHLTPATILVLVGRYSPVALWAATAKHGDVIGRSNPKVELGVVVNNARSQCSCPQSPGWPQPLWISSPRPRHGLIGRWECHTSAVAHEFRSPSTKTHSPGRPSGYRGSPRVYGVR
jgi:hypothetical protein